MAPSPKPSASRKGLVSRFTAKVGPLPVWAWAAVILGAYFLFSRMRPPAATTNADTASASTPDGTTGAAQVPSSGGGSPASNMSGDLLTSVHGNTAAIDALTSQILSAAPFPDEFGDAPAAGSGGDASKPTANDGRISPSGWTPTPARVGASAAHETQTGSGVLKWGGVSFTSQAAFNQWAKAHGTTATAELKQHPQARMIYGTLKS